MIAMGCDVGNLFTKAVIFDEDELVASKIVRTTGNVAEEIDGLLDCLIAEAKLKPNQVEAIAATGKGADFVTRADFIEETVNCIGAAAIFFLPDVRLALSIGGQSIASIRLDEDGLVTNLMRNDKCASGSGRLIEVIGAKLDLEIEEIDPTIAKAIDPVSISNQCGVFAESEVISYVNDGRERSDIMAGICGSVANIAAAQVRRFGAEENYTVIGGVAGFESVVSVLEEKLEGAYHPFPHDPQLAGAIGAALFAGSE